MDNSPEEFGVALSVMADADWPKYLAALQPDRSYIATTSKGS